MSKINDRYKNKVGDKYKREGIMSKGSQMGITQAQKSNLRQATTALWGKCPSNFGKQKPFKRTLLELLGTKYDFSAPF